MRCRVAQIAGLHVSLAPEHHLDHHATQPTPKPTHSTHTQNRDRYNAALAAGEAVGSLSDELARLDKAKGREGLDFSAFITK